VQKIALTTIAYWCVWIYLLAHGPMKKLAAGLFSPEARLPLTFIVLGTLILSLWTWRKVRECSGLLDGTLDATDAAPASGGTGAKWLGVLAWFAIGVFAMGFPVVFLGSSSPDLVFVGAGLLAWVIALWVAFFGSGRLWDADFTGVDIDLDP